jgi:serine/threonine protein kinase
MVTTTMDMTVDRSSGGTGPVGSNSKKSIVIIIAAAVCPVVVLAVACLFGFWYWSHRQRGDVLNGNGDETELVHYKAPERAMTGSPEPTIDLSSLNIIQKIGGGRFAEVWKATLADELVAVKIFPQPEKQSWTTEKDVYTNPVIDHNNLRRFLAAECRADGDSLSYWMVLDFYELGSLSDYLKVHVLELDDVCKMAASVAAGLGYLHSEIASSKGMKPAIAHRDLKSRNVLVKNDGTCCICDLGLSIKFQSMTSLTEAQGQVHTWLVYVGGDLFFLCLL